jgi:hypothetical protein
MSDEELAWREAIDEGTKLDCVKIDPEHKIKGWSRCTVKSRV